ncbi:hypothetical protein B6U80_02425 [Candidatus Pacearchaeota archaeon ex4484_26]|nr:MAG: hypothetical protein B6U80_02425 [Candidatus Pacearchaeota archaeon ex4484_26]RLF36048.1 MAG: hypothetical protein DRM99_03515 [Thermoplasmata archaeon]
MVFTNIGSLAIISLLGIWFWIIVFWSAIWKGIALWKSGRNNQLVWFICLFIFNTLGILPIIYLLFFQPKAKVLRVKKAKKARRKKRR